jgi:hypothetical protein
MQRHFTHPAEEDTDMDDRERMAKLKTEEMTRGTVQTTEDVRRTAEEADRARRGESRFMPPEAQRHETEAKMPLFPETDLQHLRSQWTTIQSEFVDEPRRSVEEADHLVAQTIQRLAQSFANARSGLEGQWARGGDVSTEDLRVALQRYRSFFDRLLAV